MSHEFSPHHLHITHFASEHASLSGEVALSSMARLSAYILDGAQPPQPVQFSASGDLRTDAAGQHEPWLHLEANATLVLVCQRCLHPVAVEMQVARDFRFVATEELAAVEDEESEEDVLVNSPSFDLIGLIEDELLMDMPVTPKHDICPSAPKLSAADADFVDPNASAAHPFAALQALKGGKTQQ